MRRQLGSSSEAAKFDAISKIFGDVSVLDDGTTMRVQGRQQRGLEGIEGGEEDAKKKTIEEG
jgi:hypothetical protein